MSEIIENTSVTQAKEVKPPKKKLGEKFKENLKSFISIFKEYPITIGCLIVAAFLGTILIDMDYSDDAYLNIGRCITFLCIWAAGTLFIEELFRHEFINKKLDTKVKFWISKGIFLFVTAGISVLFTAILSNENEKMFGMVLGDLIEYTLRYLIVYCSILVLMAVYMMYKRVKVSFPRYCIDVFSALIKTTVVYGLFALGIAAIIVVFNILIYDTDEIKLLARVELFLASGIYVPAIILALSRLREEIGKFAKVVVEYVLLPLLLAAFLIIYIYILKLVIQLDLPSNEVFAILTWLFACGLPIWTMASNFETQVLGKIAKFLPFVFCPFIILQIICISLRVNAYGITMSRYMGIVVIIFEIVYVVLYLYKIGKLADFIVPVALIILTGVLLVPGINLFDSITRSQGKRLEAILDKDFNDLSDSEKNEAREIYYAIHWDAGIEGQRFLDSILTDDEQDEIRNWYYSSYSSGYRKYLSSYSRLDTVDVSEFHTMTYVSLAEYNVIYDNFDQVEIKAENGEIKIINLSAIMEDFINLDYGYEYLGNNNMFKLDDSTYIYITDLGVEIVDDHYEDFRIIGYLFEK